ncbi:molybdopterin molybdotransferase MoeA [Streptomyces sp. NPDC093225]|uniref:molybdopterin molybdotransferase MoeA n=1 Tax=Streptomyces sp. NPDC093225 TaxID=3366034 RepID=UPI00382BC670
MTAAPASPEERAVSPEEKAVQEALALVSRPGHGSPAGGTRGTPGPSDAPRPGAAAHGRGAGPGPAPEEARARAEGGDPNRSRHQNPDRDRAHPTAAPEAEPHAHRATPWPKARATAVRAARTTTHTTGPTGPAAPTGTAPARAVPLAEALGRVLATPLDALTDLPSFDTSAMDGWAVAGPGPWRVRDTGAEGGSGVLAGAAAPAPLADGEAVRIATGARIPAEATAVIRSEHARHDPDKARLYADREVVTGQDIRPRGQECRTGDRLLPAGVTVSPAVLGLAAAAGYDELATVPRPTVEVLVLGDELLAEGRPHDGLIRDALGPMLGPWLTALGAEVLATRRLGDDAEALYAAVTGSAADVVVTTGGTASGPVDHVHPVLARAGAELLVDGVAVRPGHPMLLAGTAPGRFLVGLPGNPLAAVSGLLTLAEPLLRALSGRGPAARYALPVRDDVPGHPHDTRLVPVALRAEHAVPLRYHGPAMLRGIAAADALVVVPPYGAVAGQELEVLELPWAAGGFT